MIHTDVSIALLREVQETVREVGRVAESEGIEAHYHRGGTLTTSYMHLDTVPTKTVNPPVAEPAQALSDV